RRAEDLPRSHRGDRRVERRPGRPGTATRGCVPPRVARARHAPGREADQAEVVGGLPTDGDPGPLRGRGGAAVTDPGRDRLRGQAPRPEDDPGRDPHLETGGNLRANRESYVPSLLTSRRAIRWIIAGLTTASLLEVVSS